MYLSKRERRRFNYENYFRCNFYRGYKAASAKLFQLDPIELVRLSELFAKKITAVQLEYGWCEFYEDRYEALIAAVEEVCDEHTSLEVFEAGHAALINESKPTWNRPEPDREKQREKKRRGRKPQAYQDHNDEKFWFWRGHKTSKCWKDQSKRKRQWR
jgi:hypothetical protein